MRISLTVWSQTGTYKINLSSQEKEGTSRIVLEGDHSGEIRRVLSQKEGKNLQELIDDLSVPVLSQVTRHGGNTYMLQLHNGFNSATFNWCSEAPEGWGQLSELVKMMLDFDTRSS